MSGKSKIKNFLDIIFLLFINIQNMNFLTENLNCIIICIIQSNKVEFLEIFVYNKISFKVIIEIHIYKSTMKYTIFLQNRNSKSQQKPLRFF